ncbi:hypothetical protein [Mycobacterium sp. 050134]|uniref:hypothetical protein n=1 Tax=Mycobacterium sp. 050134 TaxID=3096111 RepID=UPI002ED8EE32
MPTIETDCPVVGAGAMGMAFVDTLITETDARVVLVDRNQQPDGHHTVSVTRRVVDATYMRVTVPAMRPPPYGVAPGVAVSIEDLFARLEDGGVVLRLDRAVRPTMYRCATVTRTELEQLRRITDIVRMGRLRHVDRDKLVLDDGEVAAHGSALYVDCTADGAEKVPATPVFGDGRITLQSLRGCQQVFSAALIAHVEANYRDHTAGNLLCAPVAHPGADLDWAPNTLSDYRNQLRWFEDPELTAWFSGMRLNLSGQLVGHRLAPASAKPRVGERLLSMAKTAPSATVEKTVEKLDRLLADGVCNPTRY